ncbi:MAG: hypothetical protein AAGG48_16485 [Planctomycetota bacterium]
MPGIADIVDRISDYEQELNDLENQLDPFDEIVDNPKVVSAMNKFNKTKEDLANLRVQVKYVVDQMDHEMAGGLALNIDEDLQITDDGQDAAVAAGLEEADHMTKNTDNGDVIIEDQDEMYEPPDEPLGKTPFEDALYKDDSLYDDDSENELEDTPGDQDSAPAETLIQSAEEQIMKDLIKYVKSQNLDPSKLQQPIEESYYELRNELMDRANDDAAQIELHIDNILADVPKTISNRLQNEVNDDVEEPSELSVDNEINVDDGSNEEEVLPPELYKELDRLIEVHISNRLGGRISDHDEVRADIIERMRNHNDLGNWQKVADTYVRMVNQNYEPKKVLIDNGFKLTSKYWKDSKGMFADTKKILVNALAAYEKQKVTAEAAKGFDRIVQFHYLERHLNNVESKAEKVKAGLNPDHHKESKAVLDGVPFAVAKALTSAQKEAEQAAKQFQSLSYVDVESNPEMRPLWQAFLRDQKNIAHADQDHFKKRFSHPSNERSIKLRDFAVDKLNLHFSYYDKLNEDINDEPAWQNVMKAVEGQLLKAFPLPFFEFIVIHAKQRAAKM